jgi:hypothetical protein
MRLAALRFNGAGAPMRSLQGRTVFVIGAASEIGPGALRFAWD